MIKKSVDKDEYIKKNLEIEEIINCFHQIFSYNSFYLFIYNNNLYVLKNYLI